MAALLRFLSDKRSPQVVTHLRRILDTNPMTRRLRVIIRQIFDPPREGMLFDLAD